MARDHARILCSIWRDADFLALSKDAQRAYMLLLSQPKLTLCGSLDYMPQRWASLAFDDDQESLEASICELCDTGFVVVDQEAGELIIRSFVKHDGLLSSPNLVQAMWKAWLGVFSEELRYAVIEQLPDHAFEPGFGTAKKAYETPREALDLRSNPPSPKGSPKGSGKGSPTPSPSPSPSPTPVVVSPTAEAVAVVLALHDLERLRQDKPDHHVGDPDRWLLSARRRRLLQDGERINAVIADHPEWTPEGCAESLLTPDAATPGPTPLDETQRAQMARMEATAKRARGEACATCDGVGMAENEASGLYEPCPTCRPRDHRAMGEAS